MTEFDLVVVFFFPSPLPTLSFPSSPSPICPLLFSPGLSGAMASISVRSGTPGSPTHVGGAAGGGGGSTPVGRRRNGLHDVDLNTFISEEMALHLDANPRKRSSAQCNDIITDSPTHKRNRMI